MGKNVLLCNLCKLLAVCVGVNNPVRIALQPSLGPKDHPDDTFSMCIAGGRFPCGIPTGIE